MMKQITLGGRFTFGNTSPTVNRMGHGAMQLAGPGVWAPPRDSDGASEFCARLSRPGVNHIDARWRER